MAGIVRNHELLSKEEETELIRKTKDGDASARDRLVLCNMRLIGSIAVRYNSHGVPMDDLIQDGVVGLLHAIDLFDPGRSFRLSTYAAYHIENKIRLAIGRGIAVIQVPVKPRVLVIRWLKARKKLSDNSLGRTPTFQEVCAHLGCTDKEKHEIAAALRARLSRAVGVGGKEDRRLASREFKEDNEEEVSNGAIVADLLRHLSTREASIIRMRFGLNGEAPKTLNQIGEELGRTRERIRQIETRALNKLRRFA